MPKARVQFSFSLTNSELTDFMKAREKFKSIEIIRRGIKQALKEIEESRKQE